MSVLCPKTVKLKVILSFKIVDIMTSAEMGRAQAAEQFRAPDAIIAAGQKVDKANTWPAFITGGKSEAQVIPFAAKAKIDEEPSAATQTDQTEASPALGSAKDQVYNPDSRSYSGLKYYEEPGYKNLMARERELNWTAADAKRNRELGEANKAALDSVKTFTFKKVVPSKP